MIDMHAHWRPAEVSDALRARTREPLVTRNKDGVEVVKSRTGEELLSDAFDSAESYLARMDQHARLRPVHGDATRFSVDGRARRR